MKNKYIERYIYAVTYHLPKKIRDDVEKELDGLITDMLETRCANTAPSEADVKAVLSELGTPEQLAAKYSGDDKLSLISGIYFLVYKRVLSIVVPLASLGVFSGSLINALISVINTMKNESNGSNILFIFKVIFLSIGGAFSGAFQAFAIITFIFVILERKKVILNDGDILTSLPKIPKPIARIKAHEPIINMIWAVLIVVLFVGCPQIFGAVFGESIQETNAWIPVFNIEYISSVWILPVFWVICQIVRETFKFIDKHYTKRVAYVTAVANILIGAFIYAFFGNSKFMSPVFIEMINSNMPDKGKGFVLPLMQNINHIILVIALVVLLCGIGNAAFKAWKNSRDMDI